MLINTLKQSFSKRLETWRFRLARPDALLHLAFFGLITGLLSGGVIVLFRLLVEHTQDYLLPGDGAENYEMLSPVFHFLFPVISSILLAFVFYKYSKGIRVLGVSRVMERVAYHQGHLTLRGFILQWVGAAIAIIGGHSVGREGPHAYLGASASSIFGRFFKLPNNSIRTLVACGAAAAIAASFNTPLAGVIFSLEVIMMEYALGSFVPVMLAAVSATALSNAVLGNTPAFVIPTFQATSLFELPIVLVLGVVVGAFAALFNHVLTLIATRSKKVEIWWKILLAGVLVGLLGLIKPEILGIGYDTVNAALLGEFALASLISLALIKIVATSISIGLGVPGGMIGPAFFIGATLGGAVGLVAAMLFGGDIANVGFYALLGMGAMMGASLQAPLAALTAIMELTYNPGIIMPGMLVIVIAQLTASEVFNKQSLFVTMLRSNGLDFSIDPVLQVLRSIGIASVLNSNFERHGSTISHEEAELLLSKKLEWIIIDDEDGDASALMSVSELVKYLSRQQSDLPLEEQMQDEDGIDLLEIPANRLSLTAISLQANLMQAHESFVAGAEALFVVFQVDHIYKHSRIYGVVTQQTIDKAYMPKVVKALGARH